MDQDKNMQRDRTDEDLDSAMENDTEVRRDTQVRGSLGIPPSGNRSSNDTSSRDEAVPEFERGSDEDRGSER